MFILGDLILLALREQNVDQLEMEEEEEEKEDIVSYWV
jgi:hypothetical protein